MTQVEVEVEAETEAETDFDAVIELDEEVEKVEVVVEVVAAVTVTAQAVEALGEAGGDRLNGEEEENAYKEESQGVSNVGDPGAALE